MATVAPKVGQVFPVGTSVGAYPASGWPATAVPPSGAPVPSATESQTVGSDGTVTFTTLTDNTVYFLGAQVGGVWTYTRLTANPTPQGPGNWLVGTHAGRPAASAAAYRGYYETDTGLAFTSDGTNWNSIKPGQDIGYAQITSAFTTTSSSAVDVTGLTITVVVGSRPIMLRFWTYGLTNNTTIGLAAVSIKEGSTTVGYGESSNNATGGTAMSWPGLVECRLTPSAGSHTYKVTLNNNTVGTAQIKAVATSPAFLQAIEV